MWQWLKDFFSDNSYQEGYEFAMTKLKSGEVLPNEIALRAHDMWGANTPYDQGMRDAIQDYENSRKL